MKIISESFWIGFRRIFLKTNLASIVLTAHPATSMPIRAVASIKNGEPACSITANPKFALFCFPTLFFGSKNIISTDCG